MLLYPNYNNMDPITASAIGSAVSTVVPSIVNTLGGIRQNNTNIANNWAVLQSQQKFAEKQAQIERAYNSPANQLLLAMQAGLNPNFLNQNGGFVPTQPAPTPSTPNMSQPNPYALSMESPSTAIQAVGTAEYYKSLIRTENDLRSGRVRSVGFDADLKFLQGKLTEEQTRFTAKHILALDKQMGVYDKQMDLLRSQRWLTDAQTLYTDTQTRYKPYEYNLAFKQAMQNIRESSSRTALNFKSMNLIDANIGQIRALTRSLTLGNDFQQQTFKFRLGQERQKWFLLYHQSRGQSLSNQRFRFDFDKLKSWYDVNQAFKLTSQIFGAVNQGLSTYEHILDVKERGYHNLTEGLRSIPFVGSGGSDSSVQSTYSGWNPSF